MDLFKSSLDWFSAMEIRCEEFLVTSCAPATKFPLSAVAGNTMRIMKAMNLSPCELAIIV